MSESSIDDATGLDVPMTGEQPVDVEREAPGSDVETASAPSEDPAGPQALTPDDPAVRGT